MRVMRKINNNVALAVDDAGAEVVVFGKGVGFGPVPYDLEDTSVIQRIFRDVDNSALEAVAHIPSLYIDAALEVMELASDRLGCQLNPNGFISLADHIKFAAERESQGIALKSPLEREIASVYAREQEVAERAIELLHDRDIHVPANEACAIALHIANAEAAGGTFSDNIGDVMRAARVVDEIVAVIEKNLGQPLDRSSFDMSRFIVHVRYLVRRLMDGTITRSSHMTMFEQIAQEFPQAHHYARVVCDLLRNSHGWECSDEEILYLMMHINRIIPEHREP